MGLVGCNADRECRQESGIYLNMLFTGDSLRASTDSARLAIDPLASDTIRFSTVSGMNIHGLGIDSLLLAGNAASTVKMPLRPDSTYSDFVLEYNNLADTLRIYHLNDMRFISLACGCFVYHTIERVSFTSAFIDSVDILNTAVTTTKENHLHIYFHKE